MPLVVLRPDLPDISVSARIARMATKREREQDSKKKPSKDVPNFGERLIAVRDEFEALSHLGSDREYTKFLGLPGTTAISQMRVPLKGTGRPPEPRLNKVAQIWKVFRREKLAVNPDWFITGEGSMLLRSSRTDAASPEAPESSVRQPAPPGLKRALAASTPQRSPFVEEVALLFARRIRADMTTKKWSDFLDGLATVEHNGLRAAGVVGAPVSDHSPSEDEERWSALFDNVAAVGERVGPRKAGSAVATHDGTKVAPLEFEERDDYETRKKAEHEDD